MSPSRLNERNTALFGDHSASRAGVAADAGEPEVSVRHAGVLGQLHRHAGLAQPPSMLDAVVTCGIVPRHPLPWRVSVAVPQLGR